MSEDVEKNITKSVCELQMDGTIWWTLTNRHNEELNERISSQGNMFNSIEEAEKERDRRNLLARLNRFRNEKNDGWIPNWNRWQELKFCIFWSYGDLIVWKLLEYLVMRLRDCTLRSLGNEQSRRT